MKLHTIFLGLLMAALPALAGCWVAEGVEDEDAGRLADFEMVKVRRVLSADRILIEDSGGSEREIRYAAVQGPPAGHALWTKARADNAQLVAGQEVQLIPVAHERGDGAEWAYVVVPNAAKRGGLLVQFELARRGMVKPADLPNERDDEYFDDLMLRAEMARREGRGLWAEE
ncbi:MAG: thermonuclease family protein [Planctomycetota bacterium]|jgi:endonuclease YncB( thermonuclease family)